MMKDYSYFYSWNDVPDKHFPRIYAEFQDNGVNNLVLPDLWLERMLRDTKFFSLLRADTLERGIYFGDAHAPYGMIYDLDCSERSQRPLMLAAQKQSIAYAAEMGCKTFTIHIGAWDCMHYNTPPEQMRDFCDASLDVLIPEAEKWNIILAVENAFEPFNTTHEVLRIAEKFSCDHLGVCFDTGHANMMTLKPEKERVKFPVCWQRAWRGIDNPLLEDPLAPLIPHIVTAHLHDNNGYEDQHQLPGTGTIDWTALMARLRACPRLVSMQTEVVMHNWSIRKLVETFEKLR